MPLYFGKNNQLLQQSNFAVADKGNHPKKSSADQKQLQLSLLPQELQVNICKFLLLTLMC